MSFTIRTEVVHDKSQQWSGVRITEILYRLNRRGERDKYRSQYEKSSSNEMVLHPSPILEVHEMGPGKVLKSFLVTRSFNHSSKVAYKRSKRRNWMIYLEKVEHLDNWIRCWCKSSCVQYVVDLCPNHPKLLIQELWYKFCCIAYTLASIVMCFLERFVSYACHTQSYLNFAWSKENNTRLQPLALSLKQIPSVLECHQRSHLEREN